MRKKEKTKKEQKTQAVEKSVGKLPSEESQKFSSGAGVSLTKKTDKMLEKIVENLKCKKEAFANMALQYVMLDPQKIEEVYKLMIRYGVEDKGVNNLEKEGF